jgi:hypothetical protein
MNILSKQVMGLPWKKPAAIVFKGYLFLCCPDRVFLILSPVIPQPIPKLVIRDIPVLARWLQVFATPTIFFS